MKFLRTILFMSIVFALLLASCAVNRAPTAVAPQAQAPVVQQPVAPLAQNPAPVAQTQSQYAPTCQQATGQCSVPTVEQREQDCVKKIPYTFIAVPVGTTYEVLTSGVKCYGDYGVDDGQKTLVTCTGPELMSFQLKVCNPNCDGGGLDMNSGRCPSGQGYDAAQQCCSPVQESGSNGCAEVKVDIGGCIDGPAK